MKSILMRTGILVCLLFLGWSFDKASAEMTWPSKCKALYGEVKPNQNPSPQHINCLLTNAALAANIPPEVVKAVAKQESDWMQFKNGQPNISNDGGIGIMQITKHEGYKDQELKDDIYYNIQAGVEILNIKYKDTPKIEGVGPEVIENWYFPVMAYNGIKPVNSPISQTDEKRNTNAYQEKVFSKIKDDSFLGDTKLAQFSFTRNDFDYDSNSNDNIVFITKEYTITDQMHISTHLFQTGNKVIVTKDGVNLRSKPGNDGTPSSSVKELSKNTTLTIDGNFAFDKFSDSNQYVWYPVKIENSQVQGFISSAYISRKLDSPKVNPVGDNDKSLSGKVTAGVRVQVKNGTQLIGNAVADGNGSFNAAIPVQKAGSKLAVTYMDQLNAVSLVTTIVVADKTAPIAPKVNKVTNKSSEISGKTEANAAVSVVIAGKTYSKKADKYGNYKIVIPVQNTGAKITVTAKDSAGNVSVASKVTVVRAAPNMPSVNKVNNKATTVSGKTEAKATVTVKIASKTYKGKANSYGNYKVVIPVQNTGTSLSVTAKDGAGRVSASRSIKIIRVAPNLPIVNKVRYNSNTVSGKTEKYATVTVKIGKKNYTAKANVYGNFKVKIPKQRAGTKLYVNAKDAKEKISATRTVAVSK
ncbi:Ig-like domain-containing protein [Neobacillus mesonae]|uniref:Ig-like domain-containing protein n=1 Tax=Neobacillus mesonae TaxID=1193713 RepID=UPI000830A414|nr:Ig-like domain-containing protein [Neobacillus mesonae]